MSAFALAQDGAKERFNAGQPMKRIGATEDISGLTLFLSSRASAHITVGLQQRLAYVFLRYTSSHPMNCRVQSSF